MILSDNETKLDLLNNQAIAKTIVSIIKDRKESVSLGFHGDWGIGKSSILAMVEDILNQSDHDEDISDWDEDEEKSKYNPGTQEHTLFVADNLIIEPNILFHEFTPILDAETYARRDMVKYATSSFFKELTNRNISFYLHCPKAKTV